MAKAGKFQISETSGLTLASSGQQKQKKFVISVDPLIDPLDWTHWREILSLLGSLLTRGHLSRLWLESFDGKGYP